MSFLKSYLPKFVKNTFGFQNNEPEHYEPNLTANYSGYVAPIKPTENHEPEQETKQENEQEQEQEQEHIVDFSKGYISSLPNWFQKESYKVVMGSGDTVFPDGRTDIQHFQEYDVHCCAPVEHAFHGNQLQENIAYLNENNLNIIICLIDLENENQIANFVDLFTNKIERIHYVKHGPPAFLIKTMYTLLQPGGVLTMHRYDLPPESKMKKSSGWSGNWGDMFFDYRKNYKKKFDCDISDDFEILRCVKKSIGGQRRTQRRKHRRAQRYTRSK